MATVSPASLTACPAWAAASAALTLALSAATAMFWSTTAPGERALTGSQGQYSGAGDGDHHHGELDERMSAMTRAFLRAADAHAFLEGVAAVRRTVDFGGVHHHRTAAISEEFHDPISGRWVLQGLRSHAPITQEN